MSAQPIPQGYHSVTPYLVVDGAESAIAWYARAFGAEERMRLPMGDKIGHAELRIGPKARGGPTSSLLLYVEDVDAAFARGLAEGATPERAPEDQFWGDRMGTLLDPFGHRWSIATHKEDLTEEETMLRMAEWSAKAGG